jgi:ring-1,2-phenylacetyl-CoA epoxidase subunit PaaC
VSAAGDTNAALFDYLLRLGDNALILGHRLSEWCGHGPVLEEDIALTNVALDLIGQARLYLAYAGEVEGRGRDEDALAYLRDGLDFRNLLLVEQPNGDFGDTIARQFVFDAWHHELLTALADSRDERLAAIAAKALKEATYHRRHSSEWLIRLGDGTTESHERIATSLTRLWGYVPELFESDAIDEALVAAGIAPDPESLRAGFDAHVQAVLKEATLEVPDVSWQVSGGRRGVHTEHHGYILAEMQFLQRAYPGATW